MAENLILAIENFEKALQAFESPADGRDHTTGEIWGLYRALDAAEKDLYNALWHASPPPGPDILPASAV